MILYIYIYIYIYIYTYIYIFRYDTRIGQAIYLFISSIHLYFDISCIGSIYSFIIISQQFLIIIKAVCYFKEHYVTL